ncbi:MAG: tetratricopeptide repeat protein [Wigglesworthia glossinidia]|nr:tetratricopeptide repeat protein [Wigglesworthia glossinidia]
MFYFKKKLIYLKKQHISVKKIFYIIFFLILFLILIFFYKKYEKNKNNALYESMQNWENMQKNLEKFEYSKRYKIQKNKNNYTIFILLGMAKINIENNEYDAALLNLKKALSLSKDLNLKSLISLRLARLMLQQNDTENAKIILDNINYPGWKELALYILNHDIHFEKNI